MAILSERIRFTAAAGCSSGPWRSFASGESELLFPAGASRLRTASASPCRIDPASHRIIALKSSIHFRADFAPLAEQILIVVAPGENVADPERLGYSD